MSEQSTSDDRPRPRPPHAPAAPIADPAGPGPAEGDDNAGVAAQDRPGEGAEHSHEPEHGDDGVDVSQDRAAAPADDSAQDAAAESSADEVQDAADREQPEARPEQADLLAQPVRTGRPDRSATGDSAVDTALEQLEAADGAPMQEQIDELTSAHRTLQSRLSDLHD